MNAKSLLAALTLAASLAANADSLQFSVATQATTEGVAYVAINVSRLLPAAGQAAGVTWTTTDGTAFAGSDFGTPGVPGPITGTLTWAAGIGGSKQIRIPITNDTVLQPDARTFTVQLSDPVGTGVILGTINTVTVRINDNDKGFRFAQDAYGVQEDARTVVLTVQRIGSATMAATATWTTANGTATAGQDFGVLNNPAQRTGTLSWLAGDATDKTISIPIIDDRVGGEGDETFTVTLTPGTGYVVGTPGVATVTIHDNDLPPESELRFTQQKYTVLEDAGTVMLNVERVDIGGGLARPATVTYSTANGTAMATADYVTKTGTLTWAAGEGGAKPITITIVNNTIPEPLESFTVRLTNPASAVGLGAPNEASVLIVDDDERFPPEGAIPAGFTAPVDSTKGFHVSNDPGAFEGVYTLKSDFIDDGESAGIQMSGTFAAGPVSFRVKVSTEPTFDVLSFYIDGVLQTSWSGNTVATWQMSPSYPLTAGAHTLKWVYQKDASVSMGSDAVYVDGLVTPAFTPAP